MEYYSLNVFQKTEGSIFLDKRQTNSKEIWPLLTVTNKPLHFRATTDCCKGARFICTSLNNNGERILAGDRHGNIFVFDLKGNKFWLMNKVRCCCIALAFTPLPERDILVASSDCQLHLYQSSNNQYIANMKGHETCINHIVTDQDGYIALTSSRTESIVWDLIDLTVLHYLRNPFEKIDLIKSVLISPSESVLSFFRNDAVMAWNLETESYKVQYKTVKSSKRLTAGAADVSSDGKMIALAGKADFLLLWNTSDPDKPKTLSIGSSLTTSVRQVAFIGSYDSQNTNQVLAVVSHEGRLSFYSAISGDHLFNISSEGERILHVVTAKNCPKIVTLTGSGQLQFYNLQKLFETSKTKKPTVMADLDDLRKPVTNKKEIDPQLSESTIQRLKALVKERGSFPEKYRFLIWSNFLQLPDNVIAFNKLSSKGIHEKIEYLETQYPIENATHLRSLLRTLSLLTHWCPRLGEVDFVPMLSFPFVKLLHQNPQMCLEVIIFFLLNWSQNWFAYYPSPPFNILSAVEDVLSEQDENLMLHFIRLGVTPQIYAWLLMRSIFTEVFSKEKWLILFDHIVSNSPAFLLYLVASFNIINRNHLLKCTTVEEIQGFYQRQSKANVNELAKRSHIIESNCSKELATIVKDAAGQLRKFPNEDGLYPSFENFPAMVLNFEAENEKLQEEIDYIKKRQERLLLGQHSELMEVTNMDNSRKMRAPVSSTKPKILGFMVQNEFASRSENKGNINKKENSFSAGETFSIIRNALETRRQVLQKSYASSNNSKT